jgi:hypothetical protein
LYKKTKLIFPKLYHFKKLNTCWALVAHTSNPSYSGGSDQEDRGSKPAWAREILERPYLEKTHHIKGLVE